MTAPGRGAHRGGGRPRARRRRPGDRRQRPQPGHARGRPGRLRADRARPAQHGREDRRVGRTRAARPDPVRRRRAPTRSWSARGWSPRRARATRSPSWSPPAATRPRRGPVAMSARRERCCQRGAAARRARPLRPVRWAVRAGGAHRARWTSSTRRTGTPMADEAFQAELDRLAATTPGCRACSTTPPGSRTEVGARILLKREDLNHTGAHKIRNVLGQALLDAADGQAARHRRDRRRPARRGQRHRGRAVRARVRGLHGRGGHPPAGAQRGPDAAARRDGRAGDHRLAHAQGRDERGAARLGDQCGQHPLPDRYGRRSAPVPGDGARLRPRHRGRGARSSAWS